MPRTIDRALIVGGSRGSGREIALALSEAGTETTVVARGSDALEALKAVAPRVRAIATDASADGVAVRLMRERDPDLVVLAVGHEPKMAPFHEQSWEDFSGSWNIDTRIAHGFSAAALTLPMRRGGTIVSFSSGAALAGSRLTGGYAGAKRMQHFISDYAQREADRLGLDLTFHTVIPKQLVAGSVLGEKAATAYARAAGISIDAFMAQWDVPLTPAMIARHVTELALSGERSGKAIVLTGTGMGELP
ncbi:MAG: SDR family oxidoreductase [Pseudomonadota bacterium]